MSGRPRALFFGTPALAVASLDAVRTIAEVAAVICQPDRPAGRGLELSSPAVKVYAEQAGLPVAQPAKIRTPEFRAWVREQRADFALVLAYGRILPPDLLAAPRLGCLNLHASLLPRYRGAAPITWAIVRGEKETGVSLMQMDEGLDTGPVYVRRALAIGDDETAGDLAGRISALSAEVVLGDLPKVLAGELTPAPQDGAQATSAPPLTKDQGRIDWERTATEVHDHVRGMTPWPGAFTRAGGKLLKILETRRSTLDATGHAPGTLIFADPGGVLVACGRGAVEISRAQLEGRRALSARELVSGRALVRGARLG